MKAVTGERKDVRTLHGGGAFSLISHLLLLLEGEGDLLFGVERELVLVGGDGHNAYVLGDHVPNVEPLQHLVRLLGVDRVEVLRGVGAGEDEDGVRAAGMQLRRAKRIKS